MWTVIIATLRLAVTPLTIAAALIRNLDNNQEGVDDKLADTLDKAIEVILGVAATDDTVSGQARGLVAISNFCRGVLAALDAILATSPPYTDTQKAEATALSESLFDSAKVYQAVRGEDAKVLAEAQAAAKDKLGTILNN